MCPSSYHIRQQWKCEGQSGLKRASSLSGMLSSFPRQVLFPQHFGEFDVPNDKTDTV
jgi:hypothetical protein